MRRGGCLVLLAGCLSWTPPAPAQEGFTAPQTDAADSLAPTLGGMEERVSLDLRSVEATDALKYLATKGGLNIAISKNVSGRVNLFLTDVPIRDVFDLILRSNELAYDLQGDVYNVMTEAEYRALYGKRFADLRRVETFRLQYAIPEQAFNLLDTLKSEIGRLLIEQLKDYLELKKLGTIKADERSNQVVVKTLPQRMAEVATMIGALDQKTREVLIDSKIVKVNLTENLNTGIDWDKVFSNLKFHGIDNVGDFRTATTGTAPSEVVAVTKIRIPNINVPGVHQTRDAGTSQALKLGSLAFGTVARDGYELFRFLETLGQTKVISNPRILVTENQEARIHVGTREAYITTTTTTGQTTTTTAEEVEFIDVGIQLLVTPTNINTDGYVTMKIKPEVSSVIRTLTTPSNNQIPIVDTSTAETNVMVLDGTTIIIGGLRKDEKKYSNDQVPVLGRIPILGEIFKQRDQDGEKAELVVFITPHILAGDQLVTGDEKGMAGTIKPYRDYPPLLKGTFRTDTGPGGAP
ncbi:MAG: hypothetical protein HYY91_00020 [Candidatus Omnitrophica bacterium]|nr:hypothetical protein [Candidatus Omnitrophota bacterium]